MHKVNVIIKVFISFNILASSFKHQILSLLSGDIWIVLTSMSCVSCPLLVLTTLLLPVQGLAPIRTEEKSFRTGYSECLSEVAKMLMFSPAIDEMTRNKLVRGYVLNYTGIWFYY